MTPAANERSPHSELSDQMRAELTTLLGDTIAGELSSVDFYDRLTDIHARHLADANSAASKTRRSEALRAFERLTREAPSRHHELELLADALGIRPD